MSMTVKIDRQGRVVIPQHVRVRLGLEDGGTLELVTTPEGVVLERRRRAFVTIDEDGLPRVLIDGLTAVSNNAALGAIHEQRDGA